MVRLTSCTAVGSGLRPSSRAAAEMSRAARTWSSVRPASRWGSRTVTPSGRRSTSGACRSTRASVATSGAVSRSPPAKKALAPQARTRQSAQPSVSMNSCALSRSATVHRLEDELGQLLRRAEHRPVPGVEVDVLDVAQLAELLDGFLAGLDPLVEGGAGELGGDHRGRYVVAPVVGQLDRVGGQAARGRDRTGRQVGAHRLVQAADLVGLEAVQPPHRALPVDRLEEAGDRLAR